MQIRPQLDVNPVYTSSRHKPKRNVPCVQQKTYTKVAHSSTAHKSAQMSISMEGNNYLQSRQTVKYLYEITFGNQKWPDNM